MMIKILLMIISSFTILLADSTDYSNRQKILLDIKQIVQKEEEIARSFEKYILTNYSLPANITALYTTDYLGTSADFTSSISNYTDNFKAFSLLDNSLTYTMKDSLEGDIGYKSLYEGDTFRKRTYYRNSRIYLVLEDVFAKHLYDIIKQKGSGLSACSSLASGVSCILNNHVYIKPTYSSGKISTFLMAYHIEKFRTGPIIVTDNTTLHSTESEFKSIPKGALIYDVKGAKFIKTNQGVEVLK